MGELLAMAAGCAMAALIVLLVLRFLADIGIVRKTVPAAFGRVLLICALHGAGVYVFLLLADAAFIGTDEWRNLPFLQRDNGLSRMCAGNEPFLFYMQLNFLLMTAAGCFVCFADGCGEGSGASGRLHLFYLLPGMEMCFLPVGFGFVPVLAGAGVFLLGKKVPFERLRPGQGLMAALTAVLVAVRCLSLYAASMGV